MEQTNNILKKKSDLIVLLKLIIYILIVCLLCIFTCGIYKIESTSMYPTLDDNNYIFVEKLSKHIKYDYDDIVIFDNDAETYIKRIVALQGDDVEVYSNKVLVNGYVVDRKVNTYDINYHYSSTVPTNSIFIMGDNRTHSIDSRYFGSIDKSNVIGKLLFYIKGNK